MARIIVTGYMIRLPFTGNMLAFVQHVVGLQRLGHEVVYLEESGWADSCYNPTTQASGDDPEYGLEAVRFLLAELGAGGTPLVYVNRESGRVYGASRDRLTAWLGEADLLLNIGGVCWLPEFERCRRLALIDLDPMFTQAGKFGQEGLDHYQCLFTYGTNINGPDSGVPKRGRAWIPTVPPVLTDLWDNEVTPDPAKASLTTIANWSAYGSTTFEGEVYGQKDVEFERLLNLPRHVPCALTIRASGIKPTEAERFRRAGWIIRPPGNINTALSAYRDFIAQSLGEFSVAKHGYIKSRCGWVSDRTVCYLASGRPAVIADTGDSPFNRSPAGVLTFQTLEEAADSIHRLLDDYTTHAREARALARQRFSHEVVLTELIEQALGVTEGIRTTS